MIVIANDSDRETIEIPGDARNVCPGVFTELVVLQERTAFLGAEKNVIEKLLMDSHVSPSGLGYLETVIGGLRHRQRMFRPPGYVTRTQLIVDAL